MVRQVINNSPAGSGLGDNAFTWSTKDNANFAEVYAGLQPYTPPFTGGVATTITSKLAQMVSVTDFGAVSGTDCAAAVTLAAAASAQVIFPAGVWPMATTPTIPLNVALIVQPGATFTGGGALSLGFSTSSTALYTSMTSIPNPSVTSVSGDSFVRLANYSGGSGGVGGAVVNALRIQTNVGAAANNNEWGLLSVLNNNTATSSTGQNVAAYFQARKSTVNGVAAGITWGITVEARDQSGLANPTTGHIGAEIDLFADGSDTNAQRVMLDLVGGPGVSIGPTITYGLRIGPVNGTLSAANWANGIYLYGDQSCAIRINTSTGAVVGIDTSGATLTGSALRIGGTQYIGFDSSDGHRLGFNSASNSLGYIVSGTLETGLLSTGGLGVNNAGTFQQVIGPRIGGYGTPTGNAYQVSFAAGSITLPNLAAAVAQLILDMKTHGAIGT